MNIKILSLLYFFVIFTSGTRLAVAQDYINQGQFKTWTVFSGENMEACFAISSPKESEGKYTKRGTVQAAVVYRPRENGFSFISLEFGYPFAKDALVEIKIDKKRLRPIDADLQIPDTNKFKKHTGWEPKISFEETMKDLLDYWRVKVNTNPNQLLR